MLPNPECILIPSRIKEVQETLPGTVRMKDHFTEHRGEGDGMLVTPALDPLPVLSDSNWAPK